MAHGESRNEDDLHWSDDSSDESYCPSLSGEELSDDEDLDRYEWIETPLRSRDIKITFDSIGRASVENYLEEKTQIKARVMSEIKSIGALRYIIGDNTAQENGPLTDNEVLNCFFSPPIALKLFGVMNKGLGLQSEKPMDQREFEVFIRLIFYFSYYNKGPAEVCNHPENFPEAASLIQLLSGNTDTQRKERVLSLMRSVEGDGGVNRRDTSKTWSSVFDIDQDLEEVFCLLGRQASKLCFVLGRTNLIIDDDKLKLRSALAAALSLVRSKGLKSFGPVANCVNSLTTGVNLSTYMLHHGESALVVTQANLMNILGVQTTSMLSFPDTNLGGDRGYNDEEMQECLSEYDLEIFNTVKRGPALPYKFGKTSYKTSRDQ